MMSGEDDGVYSYDIRVCLLLVNVVCYLEMSSVVRLAHGRVARSRDEHFELRDIGPRNGRGREHDGSSMELSQALKPVTAQVAARLSCGD